MARYRIKRSYRSRGDFNHNPDVRSHLITYAILGGCNFHRLSKARWAGVNDNTSQYTTPSFQQRYLVAYWYCRQFDLLHLVNETHAQPSPEHDSEGSSHAEIQAAGGPQQEARTQSPRLP